MTGLSTTNRIDLKKTTNICDIILYLSKFISLKNPSLFEGLKIEEVEDFEKKCFRRCNVFYLDLGIKKKEHVFGVVERAFKDSFNKNNEYFPDCNLELNTEKLEYSLTHLIVYLKKRHVILILLSSMNMTRHSWKSTKYLEIDLTTIKLERNIKRMKLRIYGYGQQ